MAAARRPAAKAAARAAGTARAAAWDSYGSPGSEAAPGRLITETGGVDRQVQRGPREDVEPQGRRYGQDEQGQHPRPRGGAAGSRCQIQAYMHAPQQVV